MRFIFCFALVSYFARLTVCQDKVLGPLGVLVAQQLVKLYESGTFELFRQDCQYEVKPRFDKFKLIFEGKAWCPGLTNITGYSRTDSRTTAIDDAMNDLVAQISESGLDHEQVEGVSKRMTTKEVSFITSAQDSSVADKIVRQERSLAARRKNQRKHVRGSDGRERKGSVATSKGSRVERGPPVPNKTKPKEQDAPVANKLGPGTKQTGPGGKTELGGKGLPDGVKAGPRSSSIAEKGKGLSVADKTRPGGKVLPAADITGPDGKGLPAADKTGPGTVVNRTARGGPNFSVANRTASGKGIPVANRTGTAGGFVFVNRTGSLNRTGSGGSLASVNRTGSGVGMPVANRTGWSGAGMLVSNRDGSGVGMPVARTGWSEGGSPNANRNERGGEGLPGESSRTGFAGRDSVVDSRNGEGVALPNTLKRDKSASADFHGGKVFTFGLICLTTLVAYSFQ